jgi:hypothetical protein
MALRRRGRYGQLYIASQGLKGTKIPIAPISHDLKSDRRRRPSDTNAERGFMRSAWRPLSRGRRKSRVMACPLWRVMPCPLWQETKSAVAFPAMVRLRGHRPVLVDEASKHFVSLEVQGRGSGGDSDAGHRHSQFDAAMWTLLVVVAHVPAKHSL